MSRIQTRPKAQPTSNASSQSASAQSASATKNSFSNVETHAGRQHGRASSADALSDRAALLLIRRTLCSQLGDKGRTTPAPINELLPPLTSSNEVDLQLYAIVSIIIRETVQVWYNKFTPDQMFVEEVVKIIAHCTRALEQRLRNVDLESLLFDELPELLELHIQAYRGAHQPLHPPPIDREPRQIYHSLWPLPALSPVPDGEQNIQFQKAHEAAYRQLLVQGVLGVLLPTEDLENDCLTTLVGQIFSEMILGGGIGGKASEPWLLWEGITKIAEVVQSQFYSQRTQVRLERSKSDLMKGPSSSTAKGRTKGWRFGSSIPAMFWLILQYGYLAFTTVRFFVMAVATSSSLPPRIAPMTKITGLAYSKDHKAAQHTTNPETMFPGRKSSLKQPIIKMRLWPCVSSLLDVDIRMPWLSGTVSMLQWGAMTGPGQVGLTDGMLDKILSHAIQTYVLDPVHLPTLLRAIRAALFPNNTLAPPRVVPLASAHLLIRRRCAESLLSLLPVRVQDIYFGPDDSDRRVKEVEELLNVFSDNYCNKHLLYGVVELIVVRLMPEIAENGVEELLEGRLS